MALLQWLNSDKFDAVRDKTNAAITAIGKVLVSSGDTTMDYLFNKLVAGSNITLTKNNSGANETITIAATGISTKADKTQLIVSATSAVGPTTYQSETLLATLTPSSTLSASLLKITFQGYVNNGDLSNSAGTVIKIKKNGTEIWRTVNNTVNNTQCSLSVVTTTNYSAGDIITATATCSISQTMNYYSLICETLNAA